MCSSPVTFGGGIAIEKFSAGRSGRRRVEVAGLEPLLEHARLDLARVVARALPQCCETVLRHGPGSLDGRNQIAAPGTGRPAAFLEAGKIADAEGLHPP